MTKRLLAAAMAMGLVSPLAVSAGAADQALPGYTIVNPPLPAAQVGGQPTQIRQGIHKHSGFMIEVPPNWNGRLTMWAHGYRDETKVLTVAPPQFGLRQVLLDQGYAWAASSYYSNSYDVKAGVTSTRDLAQFFSKEFGKPKKTFIAGTSMGGHIIARSLEEYPGMYQGALPLCGVLGDHELFDYIVDVNVVAQNLTGIRAYPAPADYLDSVVPRIIEALGPHNEQLAAIVAERSGGPRPGIEAAYAYWRDFLLILGMPPEVNGLAGDPLQLATNLGTDYRPNDPADVNASVQRVPPVNPRDRFTAKLTEVPQVLGRPTAPVLSLHNLGDLFIPFSMQQSYYKDVAASGRTNMLVQRAIRTTEHCEFSPGEIATAWSDLVKWVDHGQRPAGDVVHDRAVVADPKYGCRFSDAAFYEEPDTTRKMFAPC